MRFFSSPRRARRLPVLLCLLALAAGAGTAQARQWRVVDGDSIEGADGWRGRLLCIDAPELKQKRGKAARKMLKTLINDNVAIRAYGQDRYKRDLVLVYDGKNLINLQMVRQGLAWAVTRFDDECRKRHGAFAAAQREAQAARRGVWKQRKPTPPWKWRQENPFRGQENPFIY